ncbi:hypothetical protein AUP68_15918 [Ilyonectria robusta]
MASRHIIHVGLSGQPPPYRSTRANGQLERKPVKFYHGRLHVLLPNIRHGATPVGCQSLVNPRQL